MAISDVNGWPAVPVPTSFGSAKRERIARPRGLSVPEAASPRYGKLKKRLEKSLNQVSVAHRPRVGPSRWGTQLRNVNLRLGRRVPPRRSPGEKIEAYRLIGLICTERETPRLRRRLIKLLSAGSAFRFPSRGPIPGLKDGRRTQKFGHMGTLGIRSVAPSPRWAGRSGFIAAALSTPVSTQVAVGCLF
jgi:hypothetical protein